MVSEKVIKYAETVFCLHIRRKHWSCLGGHEQSTFAFCLNAHCKP